MRASRGAYQRLGLMEVSCKERGNETEEVTAPEPVFQDTRIYLRA